MLGRPTTRVLIVEDFELWRRFICSTLQKRIDCQVIWEESDGLRAVRKARELRPDLILMDIGLPSLDGIEAARRIHEVSPTSKILFVSENHSWEAVEEALLMGGAGYVLKSDAGTDLLTAIDFVLRGKQFVSASVLRRSSRREQEGSSCHDLTRTRQELRQAGRHHEVGFYSDDRSLLDQVAAFIGTGLKNGSGVIVAATECHQDRLLLELRENEVDIDVAIKEGKYLAVSVDEALSALLLNGMPHPVRFFRMFSDLIMTVYSKGGPVMIFGECARQLWMDGNAEGAIQLEKLGNELATTYDVNILCGYSLTSFQGGTGSYFFEKICSLHSAVHSK